MKNVDGQLSLFGHDTWSGKMSPELSRVEQRKAKTSESSWRKSFELKYIPFLSLDLTPGGGNLLGEFEWELISPWRGDALMLNTGVSPREEIVSSLWSILQAIVQKKYYLTKKACLGILRRARERGKRLPWNLACALRLQAGVSSGNSLEEQRDSPEEFPVNQVEPFASQQQVAFAANQRDEVRDLNDKAGALGAQPGMKQQTFVASFSAGAGASAGGIGYSEEITPTLKGTASGNCMPTVLCLNDQGGNIMECSEDKVGTLRAQEHGHQPLVLPMEEFAPMLFENHGIDSRYTGPHDVAPTMSARYGTGGNNVPLVSQGVETYCIMGNAIDREPHNGGNGIGYQEDIAYTLTATDHHAVFSRQRVDVFCENDVVSTQSARQHKDATDLVWQESELECDAVCEDEIDDNAPAVYLIRRLTPTECERLQGFPDDWTDVDGASDSVRYKALGNSVAMPCVYYIMQGIALALDAE